MRAPPAPRPVEIQIDVADVPEPLPIPGPDPAALADALAGTAPGSPERQRLLERLAAAGADAATVLCARLPGPLEVAPEALDTTPPEAQGPVLAALVAIGAPASRAVAQVLADPEPSRRRAAAAVLVRVAEASSYVALADRAFDPDPAVSRAAVAALAAHRRDPKMRPVPERLRRALLSGVADKPVRAARAIGALRDVESIPGLIQVLESGDPAAAEAAADALARITLQRLGTDARRWLSWWKQNRGRGRADWLFSGLASEDRAVRAAAAEELGEAGDSPVAYSPDLPAGEREKAARAWASWWARSGRVL
jgi:HEAT repeat protein